MSLPSVEDGVQKDDDEETTPCNGCVAEQEPQEASPKGQRRWKRRVHFADEVGIDKSDSDTSKVWIFIACAALLATAVLTGAPALMYAAQRAHASSMTPSSLDAMSGPMASHNGSSRPSPVIASNTTSVAAPSYSFIYTEEGLSIFEELMRIAKQSGPLAALSHSEALQKSNKHYMAACHPMLHRLGRTIFNEANSSGLLEAFAGLIPLDESIGAKASLVLQGGKPPDPLPDGRRGADAELAQAGRKEAKLLMTCNAAYLHGIVERFLLLAGKAAHGSENLEAAFNLLEREVCGRLLHQTTHSHWECRHGLGHGVAQSYRREATKHALEESLKASRHILPNAHADLWNGIWMDHFASTTVSGHDVDDPVEVLSVCIYSATVGRAGQYSRECFMYAPTAFLLHRPQAYKQALLWCEDGCNGLGKAVSSSCRAECTGGVGMQTMKETMDGLVAVNRVCLEAEKRLQAKCINGALLYYQFATGARVPLSFCNDMDEGFRPICLRRR